MAVPQGLPKKTDADNVSKRDTFSKKARLHSVDPSVLPVRSITSILLPCL